MTGLPLLGTGAHAFLPLAIVAQLEAPRMTLYFSVGVWTSLAMVLLG